MPPGADRSAPASEFDRINDAFLDLSVSRGYRNVTLAMVLERADVDQPAFDRHFTDLEDCFCQLYEGYKDEFVDRISRAGAAQRTWRDRVRATAYELLRFFLEDERRARFVSLEVRQAGERAQLMLAEGVEPLFELIDQGRFERPDHRAISHATAEAVGGGILAQIITAVETGTLSADPIPQLMYSVVLPYLGSEAAIEELSIRPPPDLVELDVVPPGSARRTSPERGES